jgi:fatty-acyl-CoA synthase
MGAVMHTINIRLSAEQIRYVIGHAEDSVLIADASLASALGPVLADGRKTGALRHLVVYGDGGRSALSGHLD